jgi:hypothetical protein
MFSTASNSTARHGSKLKYLKNSKGATALAIVNKPDSRKVYAHMYTPRSSREIHMYC